MIFVLWDNKVHKKREMKKFLARLKLKKHIKKQEKYQYFYIIIRDIVIELIIFRNIKVFYFYLIVMHIENKNCFAVYGNHSSATWSSVLFDPNAQKRISP